MQQIECEMEARVNNLEVELAPLFPESNVMKRFATNYVIAINLAEKIYFLQLKSTCVHFLRSVKHNIHTKYCQYNKSHNVNI